MEKSPPRVVIDSNIVISGLVFGGNPYVVLLLAISGQIQSVVSGAILSEIEEAFERRFPMSLEDKRLAIQEYSAESIYVALTGMRINIVRDMDDNKIIETALQGKCDFIITGDNDLLVLKKYINIKILTAKEFLEEFTTR